VVDTRYSGVSYYISSISCVKEKGINYDPIGEKMRAVFAKKLITSTRSNFKCFIGKGCATNEKDIAYI
jgi:hypothetical protein